MEKNIHLPYTQDELAAMPLVLLTYRLERTNRVIDETHNLLGSSWGTERFHRDSMNESIGQLHERLSEIHGEFARRDGLARRDKAVNCAPHQPCEGPGCTIENACGSL